MMRSRKPFVGSLIWATFAVGMVAVAAPPPSSVIEHADSARGDSRGVIWDVTVSEKKRGKVKSADYRVHGRGYNSLVEFVAPPKSKGRKLLMVDRAMWFIKPGLSRPVPISPRQRLLGSASNGDLASTNYASDYHVTAWKQTKLDGVETYEFELKAKTKKATYDRVRYWVSKKSQLGLKAEFHTVSGKLLKTATFEYEHQVSDGPRKRRFISKMTIKEPDDPNAVTMLAYRNVRLQPVPASRFNLNLLVR